MRHLMSPLDFSVEELDQLFDLAGAVEQAVFGVKMQMAKARHEDSSFSQ